MLKNKRKFILVCLLGILTLFLFSDFSFATELEIEYPTFGDAQTPMSTKTWLPDYIKYIFNFSLILAGIIAFGSLAYGGFCYLIATGNPTAIREGKDQILASILGLIIILCSFLILNTINPQLLILNPAIKGTPSPVVLYKKANCPGGTNPEQSGEIEGIDYMRIKRSEKSLDKLNSQVGSIFFQKDGSDLNVTTYSDEGWMGGKRLFTKHEAETCINSPGIMKSIKLRDMLTGVYLCKNSNKENCLYYNSSTAAFPPEWDNQITYIFYKQPKEGAKYRAILHENKNYKGACHFIDKLDGNVKNIKETNKWVSSITIFKQPEEAFIDKGIILYKNRDYNVETCALHPGCANGKCAGSSYCGPGNTSPGCFCDGTHLNATQTNTPENFNSGDSIYIDGNYMAILFEHNGFGGECEVFFESDPFLRDNPIAKCPTYEYSVLWPWPIATIPHACFKSYIIRQGIKQ